ncbi:uncharacterized protein A4U43_C04F13580 [Asparagus officinalis]|uniref:RIN4 pathogenic type III effector avirulence factor Avr cleavage site domain-containing protein n=1 Tax=Asparagus officinalis TaxID=4686 RepID=A0A5P1F0M4_ASPOF|nr:RPM1-interacting protein 4-like isoform X2 [Asparagus officinalis]ONK71905.1 uncharacterized protein A4U43_C04F13580 [Asparagus officinalis]
MEHAHVPEHSTTHQDARARRSSTDSPYGRHGDPPRKVSRTSGGSDHSVEQSPLRRNQAKSSWERRGSLEGGHGVAPNTPGSRFKTRPGDRGDESPDKSSTVPKFGEWNENDPESGEGFTHIFDKVRKEKQTGSSKVPHITNDSAYLNDYGHGSSGNKASGCCCFSWRKK